MEITIVVVLLIAGILFLLLELFLIPGLTLAGIAAGISLIGAVYYAYTEIGAVAGHLTLLASISLSAISIYLFLKSNTLEKMALKTKIKGENDPLAGFDLHVGDVGKTLSRLAPMGKIRVNGQIMEAKSLDGFIDQGVEVKITEILNTNVVVERVLEVRS